MNRRDQARCARLACERKAAELSLQMRRGVHGLDAVTASVFFLVMFLTLIGIVNSFPGINGEKHALFLRLMGALGRSLRPIVIGLAVGIVAKLFAAYVRARADELAVEMYSAGLQLENYLLLYQNDRGRPNTCSAT